MESPSFEKLQRDSVQAELKFARAKRARIGALNRLSNARRNARKTLGLYLRGEATATERMRATFEVNQARGKWARYMACSDAAQARAFDARFDLKEAQRARSPLWAR